MTTRAETDVDSEDGDPEMDDSQPPTGGPTADYRHLSDNPYAQPVPEDFEWPEAVPRWEDEPYLEAVALRLLHHYDLWQEYEVDDRQFPMYGQLYIQNERHAMHPSLSFAEHTSREHVFVVREDRPTRSTIDDLEAFGEQLADRWIEASEDHYSTDFTFAVVAETLADDVQSAVADYRNRTLLRYGYHGHYEINVLVVAPDEERLVESENTDLGSAFRTWESIERDQSGLVGRLLDWITR